MMDDAVLSEIFDAVPQNDISLSAKAACQKASDLFVRLTNKSGENVFSAIASEKKYSFSRIMRLSAPGEDVCRIIEEIRRMLFNGAGYEQIAALYRESINRVYSYLNVYDITEDIGCDNVVEALFAFYDTYAANCFRLDEELYRGVKAGKGEAFMPFFEEYLKEYRNSMKDFMLMSSFGAQRNSDASYRFATYKYIEYLLCAAVVNSYTDDLSEKSFARFTGRLTADIAEDAEAFYQLWYSVNNEVIGEEYASETFSGILTDLSTVYHELLFESKKVYESSIKNIPVAKESDMRALYKTVYELQKELDEVKKELREVKGC